MGCLDFNRELTAMFFGFLNKSALCVCVSLPPQTRLSDVCWGSSCLYFWPLGFVCLSGSCCVCDILIKNLSSWWYDRQNTDNDAINIWPGKQRVRGIISQIMGLSDCFVYLSVCKVFVPSCHPSVPCGYICVALCLHVYSRIQHFSAPDDWALVPSGEHLAGKSSRIYFEVLGYKPSRGQD